MVVPIVDVVAVGPRCRAPPSGAHPFTSVVRAARDDLAQRLPVRWEFVSSGRRRESVARSGHESPPIEYEDRSAWASVTAGDDCPRRGRGVGTSGVRLMGGRLSGLEAWGLVFPQETTKANVL